MAIEILLSLHSAQEGAIIDRDGSIGAQAWLKTEKYDIEEIRYTRDNKQWEELLNSGRNENLNVGLRWPCNSPAWGRRSPWPLRKVAQTQKQTHGSARPSRMAKL